MLGLALRSFTQNMVQNRAKGSRKAMNSQYPKRCSSFDTDCCNGSYKIFWIFSLHTKFGYTSETFKLDFPQILPCKIRPSNKNPWSSIWLKDINLCRRLNVLCKESLPRGTLGQGTVDAIQLQEGQKVKLRLDVHNRPNTDTLQF